MSRQPDSSRKPRRLRIASGVTGRRGAGWRPVSGPSAAAVGWIGAAVGLQTLNSLVLPPMRRMPAAPRRRWKAASGAFAARKEARIAELGGLIAQAREIRGYRVAEPFRMYGQPERAAPASARQARGRSKRSAGSRQ